MSNTNPNANKVHIQVHTQFLVKNNYNITLLIKVTIRSALSITYNSSVSLYVNSSGLVSILEELMKVFRISIFHIWNNQLIFFFFFVIFSSSSPKVELPPTSSNLGWLMEEDELYKDSPLKGLLAQMARSSKGEKKVLQNMMA